MSGRRLVGILGFAGFISAADNWIVSPILPVLAEEFGVSIFKAGMILTAYLIPYGIMQPVHGYVADRKGKATVLCRIVYGLAACTLACALSTSFWMLCLSRLATGFFAAGIIAVSLAIIGDTFSHDERHLHVGKFMGIVFLGQGVSVGLGGLIANTVGWRVVFLVFAVLSLCSAFMLKHVVSENPGCASRHFFSEVRRAVLSPKGMRIFPMATATGFLLLGIYSYLGAFLHDIAGLNSAQTGLIIMVYGFSGLVASFHVGKITRMVGSRKTIILGGLLGMFSALLLACLPSWESGLVAMVGLGSGYILIQSNLATYAFSVASENKGLPSALIGLGLFGGGGLGTAFGGMLLSHWGYQALWLVLEIGLLVFTMVATRVRLEKE